MMDFDEYVMRWRNNARILRGYTVTAFAWTWTSLAMLIIVLPQGRVAALLWLAWGSLLIATLTMTALALYAYSRVTEATRSRMQYPGLRDAWSSYGYTEPWVLHRD